jgi:uncharacterized membrane protein YfcA
MFEAVSLSHLLWLAAALLAAGVFTGLLAGVFGVGGGAVAVPILYELFRLTGVPEEVRMPLAVGTSLAIIIPTSIRSYMSHKARGAVDTSILRIWAVPVILGVAAGSVVARYAPADLFKIVFVVVAGISAVRLLMVKGVGDANSTMPPAPVMRAYGFVIGVLSSLMGIGGGQLSNLFMTFYGRPIHQAIATSSGLGVLISIPGTIGYIYAGWPQAALHPGVAALQPPLALGYVSLLGMCLFVPTTVLAAPYGVKLAHALSKRKLEVAFAIFLLVVCFRFLWSLFS